MAHHNTNNNEITSRVTRVSWGSILAGGITALAVGLLFNLLGLGIGFSTIDPMSEAKPFSGLGTGTIIWWLLTNFIALFAGGWVAGRMAGFPKKVDGGLHGFLAWGVYTFVSFFLLASTISGIVTGVGNAASSIFGSNNNNRQQTVVRLQDARQQCEEDVNLAFAGVKNQIFGILNRAEQLNVLPEDASQEARAALQNTQQDVEQAIRDLNLDANVEQFFNNLSVEIDGEGNLNISADGEYLDRQGLKEYMVANTNLSEAEIDRLVANWENKIQNAVQEAEQFFAKAKQKALKYSERAAETLATISIVAFFILLLGAAAAFLGGSLGAPKHVVAEDRVYQ